VVKSTFVNVCLLFSCPNWSETRRCCITFAFQLCFGICHYEGLWNPDGTEIEWETSVPGLMLMVWNLLADNIDTIEKKAETLIGASKEADPKLNAEKTKRMLLSCYQNVSEVHEIKIANRSFENVSQIRYLRMTVTNPNLIKEEIKKRVCSGNSWYHSVQNICLPVCRWKLNYTKL
jgi:hypothetical protein